MQEQPQQPQPVQTIAYAMPSRRIFHPLAILSLICGLLFFFPLIAAALAIVLGWIARNKIAKDPQYRGRGMALAGMILGGLSFVGFIVSIPLLVTARQRGMQVQCMSHMRVIYLGTIMYANDNRGAVPPNAAAIQKYIGDPKIWICAESQQPVAGGGGGGLASSYIYRAASVGPKMTRVASPSKTILAYEPLSNHGGRGFCALYMDGHIEWIKAENAASVIQQIQQSAANPATPAGN